MKNQYVGDINDYKKYGLLRVICDATGWRLGVAWMLTPDDSSTDGRKLGYLSQPSKYRHFDPDLYDKLTDLVTKPTSRSTHAIESSEILLASKFFSETVPDDRPSRSEWLNRARSALSTTDVVFFDPDNGMNVTSRPLGRKGSSKYVFDDELIAFWQDGKSLLVYQHFPRVKRKRFLTETIRRLSDSLAAANVTAFRTSNVAFFLATQEGKNRQHDEVRTLVHKRWAGGLQEFRIIGW